MSNYGNWNKRYNPAQTPATSQENTNIKVGGQEYNHIDQQHVGGSQPLTDAYISIRLTVGRAAQYGSEKLECSMEMGTPHENTEEGREEAFRFCVAYLNAKIPEALSAADQTFDFENEYVTSLVRK